MDDGSRAGSILIIEDDEDIRSFAARVLELEGYHVLQAADGKEGLRMLRQNHASLVLLDLRLPDCDGWAVLEELRTDSELSSIPVAMFTAAAALSKRNQALATGVADYLVKPLSAASLKETVDRLLCRRGRR